VHEAALVDAAAAEPAARHHGTTVRVADKRREADGVVTLTLVAPDGRRLPDWAPGAHIDLVLPTGVVRQYSLCGDRWDAHSYRIGVLREPDGRGGSAYVHDALQPGDLVGIGGPRNNFPLIPAQRYLFVAGGIGITPLLPMVHQAELLGCDWQLLYGGRAHASMAFLDQLARYGERVHVRPQDEYGLLDLAGFLGEPHPDVRVYCCGPAPLLDALATVTSGWPPHAVRTERFTAAEVAPPVRDAPFEVELARTGAVVTVAPDRSVLDAVRDAGVEVLSSCRQGTCGTCETAVLSGVPDHRDSILQDDERTAGDAMFICVSRSCGGRLVLDL
jgi:ferredoxin-NADP reductase